MSCEAPEPQPDQPFPEDIPLDILYEDSDLAVINKPAGLVCHAGAGVRSGTLVNALLHHMGPLETGDPARPGIVHRLDKFTSGVMLVAKNRLAHRQLSQQFKNREVKKEYLALVHGKPSPCFRNYRPAAGQRSQRPEKNFDQGAPEENGRHPLQSCARAYGPVSLLSIRIETGRTHQIRVHLAQKDIRLSAMLYGANRSRNLPPELQAAVRELQRPFLHSFRLQFQHPRTGQPLAFECPLPAELEDFRRKLVDNADPR